MDCITIPVILQNNLVSLYIYRVSKTDSYKTTKTANVVLLFFAFYLSTILFLKVLSQEYTVTSQVVEKNDMMSNNMLEIFKRICMIESIVYKVTNQRESAMVY